MFVCARDGAKSYRTDSHEVLLDVWLPAEAKPHYFGNDLNGIARLSSRMYSCSADGHILLSLGRGRLKRKGQALVR